MLKYFQDFINEGKYDQSVGKLFIEPGGNDEETDWKLIIDVSTIWNDYEQKKISLVEFNNQYATYLINQGTTISEKIGESCWQELEPVLVNELRTSIDADKSENIYDKIYDLCDKYEILIKTNQENETPKNI